MYDPFASYSEQRGRAAAAAQTEVWNRAQAKSRENNKEVIDAEYTEITDVPMLDLKPEPEDQE